MKTDYFKIIDTQEKAYFLGLFHADGSISQRQRGNYTEIRFQISLVSTDAEVLYKFLEEVSLPSSRLKLYVPKDRGMQEQPYVKLYIAQKEFTKNLLDLKSPELIHRIPRHLYPHFIRGFFDGDGSIYVRRNFKKIFYYAASFTCYGWITEFVHTQFPLFSLREDKRTKDLYLVQSNKQSNLIQLFDYMYSDSTVHLSRKYIKFKAAYLYASTTIPKGSRPKWAETESSPFIGDEDMVSSIPKGIAV